MTTSETESSLGESTGAAHTRQTIKVEHRLEMHSEGKQTETCTHCTMQGRQHTCTQRINRID